MSEKQIGDILLCEEESDGIVGVVECSECGSTGYKTENQIARKCTKCFDARIREVRRARLHNIPKALRRFPVKFDVPVTLKVSTKDGKGSSAIIGNAEVESRINNKMIPLVKDGHNIFIHGRPGSGKTMVACGVATKFIDDGLTASYILSSEMFDMGFAQADNFSLQKAIFNSDLLIVDDFGSEFSDGKNFKISFFFKILTSRAVRQKPTIITSSYGRDALPRRYAQKYASQLQDSFIFIEILTGENFNGRVIDSAISELLE